MKTWGQNETRYFYNIVPEKIFQVTEEFGLKPTGSLSVLNSMENRVYEVEIDDPELDGLPRKAPERFRILKFYRPGRWTLEQIQEEHDFLFDLLADDIPVVAPLRLKNNSSIFTMPDEKIHVSIFPKINGRSPDELNQEMLERIGRLLARMHNVGAVRQAHHRIQLSVASYGEDSLSFLLENNVLIPNVAQRYKECAEEIFTLSRPLFSKVNYQRIHGDCHMGNLITGQQGLFWVDFDDMVKGPVVQDLWLMLPGQGDTVREERDILVSAYDQMRAFPYEQLSLIEPLRALRMIHFNAWIAKRWTDPAFPRVFHQFGTERYWFDQLQHLQNQRDMIRSALYA
jgi:Ser/Thr protein kinase RdoA (MazF antagonist)